MTATFSTSDSPVDWDISPRFGNYFFIRTNNVLWKVNFEDVCWINADGNYCYIYTREHRYAVKISLKKMIEKLSDQYFSRIHKSYIVNLNIIDKIDVVNNVLYIGRKTLPIGKVYKGELLDKLEVL